MEWLSIRVAQYELPLRLITDAGPHRFQWMCLPNQVAQVSDSFGNGWQADLALVHSSQKSGFESISRSIPVIHPLVVACFIALWEVCPSLQ